MKYLLPTSHRWIIRTDGKEGVRRLGQSLSCWRRYCIKDKHKGFFYIRETRDNRKLKPILHINCIKRTINLCVTCLDIMQLFYTHVTPILSPNWYWHIMTHTIAEYSASNQWFLSDRIAPQLKEQSAHCKELLSCPNIKGNVYWQYTAVKLC